MPEQRRCLEPEARRQLVEQLDGLAVIAEAAWGCPLSWHDLARGAGLHPLALENARRTRSRGLSAEDLDLVRGLVSRLTALSDRLRGSPLALYEVDRWRGWDRLTQEESKVFEAAHVLSRRMAYGI
jgi:hypothetical protein